MNALLCEEGKHHSSKQTKTKINKKVLDCTADKIQGSVDDKITKIMGGQKIPVALVKTSGKHLIISEDKSCITHHTIIE